MKRAVNNVPLQTVLGLIPGFTKVVVEDRKASKRYMDNADDTEKWEGLVKDIWYKAPEIVRYKWLMSKVYEVRHMPDGLMFVISTEWEEY